MAVQEIQDYFESLAKNHTYINHSDSQKHFYKIDIEEYFDKIDSAQYPIFALERAEFNLSGSIHDNISKNRTIGFMIINAYKDGDYNAINRIYDETEEVGDDFINRIMNDVETLRDKALLRDMDPNTISLQHLPPNPVELHCGVRVTFNLVSRYDKTVDKTKWKDLN